LINLTKKTGKYFIFDLLKENVDNLNIIPSEIFDTIEMELDDSDINLKEDDFEEIDSNEDIEDEPTILEDNFLDLFLNEEKKDEKVEKSENKIEDINKKKEIKIDKILEKKEEEKKEVYNKENLKKNKKEEGKQIKKKIENKILEKFAFICISKYCMEKATQLPKLLMLDGFWKSFSRVKLNDNENEIKNLIFCKKKI